MIENTVIKILRNPFFTVHNHKRKIKNINPEKNLKVFFIKLMERQYKNYKNTYVL